MKKQNPKKPPKAFDVHRTLPAHHRSHVQSHPQQHQRPNNLHFDEEETSKSKRRFTWKKTILLLILIPLILLFFIAAWDARNFSRASSKIFGSGNILGLINSDSLDTDSNGRVNVLIVGYSVDDRGHSGANLTDSIMLLSMDPENKKGYMLSIPRDFYVRFPQDGYHKINEAYNTGGIELLEQLINDNLQIDVGYSVIVNYASVREIVDSLGGVTINIQSPDSRGLYDPNLDYTSLTCCALVNYPNGPVSLNGKQALNLSRARGDAYGAYGFPRGDYNRAEHQRQILAAIKTKLTWKLVLDPRKNSRVFDAFANNIKTDINLGEVRPLYKLFSSINETDMQSVGLDKINNISLLRGSTASGLSVQVPAAGIGNYSQIVEALKHLQ